VAWLDGCVGVYNLLTRSLERALSLPVLSLAADPASPHFALVLPLNGPESQRAQQAAGEPQQKQKHRGRGARGAAVAATDAAVLLFRGGGASPVAAWLLRRAFLPAQAASPSSGSISSSNTAVPPQPLFALPGTPLAAVGAEVRKLVVGILPLFLLLLSQRGDV
jgi:hypothetical protein